ncbi:amphi-Trp domain-containing protein [Halopenitus sp. POP-27]|uniref:amphi-Trp domain-containing protein n=1 Tax=Halopenitus sp. POP-27 TaxID=2994425 RepID=UPI002468B705|nr:amphi-Trp domain-containing protein [Halopenitus sp. POP-27]
MPEETIFASESVESRESIATSLRTVADKLEAGEPVTLAAGEESVTLSVPPRATFEVTAERETEGGHEELSVELEIEWDVGTDADGTNATLSIE